MLTRRIIPCLDVLNGRVVKGVKFHNHREAGSPALLAKAYQQQGADEIVFLDIGASPEGRKTLVKAVRETASEISIPLTVGGGIRGLSDIARLLRAGADKVSVNTAAVEKPSLVETASLRFGSQCIVVAMDAKRREQGKWEIHTYGGPPILGKPTGIDALIWARTVEKLGAGEILITSMDSDGTREGYDLELTRAIAESVNIPVVASGGAGNAEHICRVLTEGLADAAPAACIFHYGVVSVQDIKKYLEARGVSVRL